jgi:predicted ATPase/DNA-binding SARP family transcriptional activator/Tfp pilus assembly protein PilF
MKLLLLGPPLVDWNGTLAPLPRERAYQLLVYLAARGGWIGRDALAALFWPDQRNLEARRNLRRILHGARQVPFATGLEMRGELMAWSVATDLAEFEQAQREGRQRKAVALWRGSFAQGLDDPACESFNQWLAFERNRIAALWRSAVHPLLKGPDAASVAELAARVLALDPFDDEALRARLEALAALGRTGEARTEYEGFVRRLAEELGAEPSAATRDLARRLEHHGSPAPAAMTGEMVGRDAERNQLHAWLADPLTRLITVVGPGGAGKTRLARAMLESLRHDDELARRFGDAPLWIELSDLESAEGIAPRIAAALGYTLASMRSPGVQIVERLRSTQRLIVFDNCEHLVNTREPGATLASLIATINEACTGIVCIATSRLALKTEGERTLALAGLPYETSGALPAQILGSEAARLFCGCARAADPGFDPAAHAREVAMICRLTGGLPLALELAAAWVRLLPCAEIVRELEADLEILQPRAGDRGVRAAFERSWSLATPHERQVLAQLAVFAGSFSREAARAVANATLPALASLADASLLQIDRGAQASRFNLHPLLREFARHKLEADPAACARTKERHAEYYAHFLQPFDELRQTDQKTSLDAIGRELAECVAAWNWAIENGHGVYFVAAAGALERYFNVRGRFAEGVALFQRACDALDESIPAQAAALARVETSLAILLYRAGAVDRAESIVRQALGRSVIARLGRARKSALNTLGLVLGHRARWDDARHCFEEALALARADGDAEGCAAFLGMLAMIGKAQGHLMPAEAMYREVLALHRSAGNLTGLATTLNNLGNLLRLGGRFEESNGTLLEALAIAEARGFAVQQAYLLLNLGLTAFAAGRFDSAGDYAERALKLARASGATQAEANALGLCARLAVRACDFAQARTELRQALQIARISGIVPIENVLFTWFGEWLAAQGQAQRARAIWSWVVRDSHTEAETRAIAQGLIDSSGSPSKQDAQEASSPIDAEALRAEIFQPVATTAA